MLPLYSKKEFESSKSRQKLPLQCKQCQKTFYKTKHHITNFINPDLKDKGSFCSTSCIRLYNHPDIILSCSQCGTKFKKWKSQVKRSKNQFCSRSCSATYNNTHKKHGTRRSKLEIWLEEQLNQRYPKLNCDFNQNDTINSELDIYYR